MMTWNLLKYFLMLHQIRANKGSNMNKLDSSIGVKKLNCFLENIDFPSIE